MNEEGKKRSMLGATLQRSRQGLTLALSTVRKTVSKTTVFQSRNRISSSQTNNNTITVKKNSSLFSKGTGNSSPPLVPGQSNKASMALEKEESLDLLYEGDRVVDKKDIRAEDRVSHILKNKKQHMKNQSLNLNNIRKFKSTEPVINGANIQDNLDKSDYSNGRKQRRQELFDINPILNNPSEIINNNVTPTLVGGLNRNSIISVISSTMDENDLIRNLHFNNTEEDVEEDIDTKSVYSAVTATLKKPRKFFRKKSRSSVGFLRKKPSDFKLNLNDSGSSKKLSLDLSQLQLPKYEKSSEDKKVIYAAIKANMFFSTLSDEEIDLLSDTMDTLIVPKDTVIIKQGDEGDECFVVRSGLFQARKRVPLPSAVSISSTVSYLPRDSDSEETVALTKLFTRGDCFGEMALIHFTTRSATLVALEESEVFRLNRSTYRKVVAFTEHIKIQQIKATLKTVPLLESLSDYELEEIAACSALVKFSKGDPIIKKGDQGSVFYIIKSGKVACTKLGTLSSNNSNSSRNTANTKSNPSEGITNAMDIILGPGDYFGERALIENEPRAGNVIALEEVYCLALTAADFIRYLGNLQDLMARNQNMRTLKALPLLRGLSERNLSRLLDNFETRRFSPGEQIIEQGTKNRELFIINSGSVDVFVLDGNDRQKHTVVGRLKPGDHFGEGSLKPNSSATAEVIAVDNVICQVIDARKHLASLKPIAGALKEKLNRRQEANARVFEQIKSTLHEVLFEDLEQVRTLGTGTFGRVKLVIHRTPVENPDGSIEEKANTYALKILQKAYVVQMKQQKNVLNEKMVMMNSMHPFILKLHKTFMTQNCLYFLLEYIPGGELFSLLHIHGGRLKQHSAKFYAACVVEGITYLHKRQVVYRDIKPENLLIDQTGYIKIVDFGFAKKVKTKTFTLCGTPEYLPPESIQGTGHNRAVDYWAIGILIYEMLAGFSPFSTDPLKIEEAGQEGLFDRILGGEFTFTAGFSREAKDLIRALVVVNPRLRLGMFKEGPDGIKLDPWFEGIDFNVLKEQKKNAPWVPEFKDEQDTQHFDQFDENFIEVPYRGSDKYWKNF